MKMRWIAGAALLMLIVGACGRSATDPGPAAAGPSFDWDDGGFIEHPDVPSDSVFDGGGGYFGSALSRSDSDSTNTRN